MEKGVKMVKSSLLAYEKKYKEGYGVMYPESHIIRLHKHFLEYKLNIKKGRLFDFGCGNGTHPLYFHSKGFDVYGVDIVEQAIRLCKQRLPLSKSHFEVIKPNQRIDALFNVKFNLILANQSLYYLSDFYLNRTLNQIHEMLENGGIVLFTMIGEKSSYYKDAKKDIDGLRRVKLVGRLNETTYINFVKSEKDLLKRFKMFEPINVGYYDFTSDGGSTFHYYFIGKKMIGDKK